MTGRYPARIGITNYLEVNDEHFLSPDYISINERLKSVGYVSALIGKWHLTGDYEAAPAITALIGLSRLRQSTSVPVITFILTSLCRKRLRVSRANTRIGSIVKPSTLSNETGNAFFLYLALCSAHSPSSNRTFCESVRKPVPAKAEQPGACSHVGA